MLRVISTCLFFAVSFSLPQAVQAQANSIMQSFHPEKFPPKDAASAKTAPTESKNDSDPRIGSTRKTEMPPRNAR